MGISEERKKKIQEEVDKWGSSFDESGEIDEFQRQRFRNNINNYYNAMYQNPDAEKMRFEVLRRLSSHNETFKQRQKEELNNTIQSNLGEYQKPSSYLNPEDPFNFLTKAKYQQKEPKPNFTEGLGKGSDALLINNWMRNGILGQSQDMKVPITDIFKTQPFANDGSINMPKAKADYEKNFQTVPINVCRFGENAYQGKDLGNNIRDFHSKYGNGTVKNTVGELIEQNKGRHTEIPLNGYMMDFDTGRYDYGNVQTELQNAKLITTPNGWSISGELKIRPDKYDFTGGLSLLNKAFIGEHPKTFFDGTMPVNISGSHFSNNVGTGTSECREKTRQDEIYRRTEQAKREKQLQLQRSFFPWLKFFPTR